MEITLKEIKQMCHKYRKEEFEADHGTIYVKLNEPRCELICAIAQFNPQYVLHVYYDSDHNIVGFRVL